MTTHNFKIKIFIFALICVLMFIYSNGSIFAQKKIPLFADYPVTEIYKGKIAPLKLTQEDEFQRDRFQWAIDNQKVDFAGRFILTTWSCGSMCLLGAVIEAKTGKVFRWNVRLNYNVENPVEYRSNSSLIILSGCRGDDADQNTGTHYFKIKNGRFVHLQSVFSKNRTKPDCS